MKEIVKFDCNDIQIMLLSRALLVLCSLFGLVNYALISIEESMRLTVILVFKLCKELGLHRNTLEMLVLFEI